VSESAAIGQFRPPDLTGAAAVVTGGGQGIGATIARDMAACGARVTIDGRRGALLEQVCNDIVAQGGKADYLVGSVADPDHVSALMAMAATGDGVIHALVNNAGIAGPTTPLSELSLEDWNETISVNLTGVFLTCRAAIPYLRAAPHGKIVNIGSVTGKRPLPNRAPYAASKLGVVGLTRTLAHELGPDNISVNTISPFLVENARLERVFTTMAEARGLTPDQLRSEFTATTAFGRPVSETDVSRITLMLCSSAADDLTGQDYNVSAGAVMY
jgi:NAD(P)-dependent dehydrogenase (short-subunit alcohol dehydrogenase family)